MKSLKSMEFLSPRWPGTEARRTTSARAATTISASATRRLLALHKPRRGEEEVQVAQETQRLRIQGITCQEIVFADVEAREEGPHVGMILLLYIC